MPNNRSIVNNQQQDASGALVEKVVNGLDAMLTKECFLKGTQPDSPEAPQTMASATELFFGVRDGNLANLGSSELTRLAENIQIVVTGSKADPSYMIIDKGEGQTPARFAATFLSLTKSNKGRIPFVQGKFNCGGTGVLPFCGARSYQLLISRRCPSLPSDPSVPGTKDATHALWGFTLIKKLPPSAGQYDTMVYVYLAPNGQIPSFDAEDLSALPEVRSDAISQEVDADDDPGERSSKHETPRPYRVGLAYGTVIKLYNYRWKTRSLATREVRFELERYLYRLSMPVRVTETRQGYRAHYFATTIAGTSVTIAKDRDKGFLEDDFPAGGEIQPAGVGALPISIALYRERTQETDKAKDPKRLSKGLCFTINGQVHYATGPEFFVTRGLNYEYIKDTMHVVVDCTGLPQDIRDDLIMPSRDRLRQVPAFEAIRDSVVADLKDRDALRAINDARRLRRVKDALTDDAAQSVLQSLLDKDPVLASLFKGGKGLRGPIMAGKPPAPAYKGKQPPTFFHFANGKTHVDKSFPIDRTCAVEIETDAINGYFEMPNPLDRGELKIEPRCYERWNLWDGRLRIVFRAPSNARIGDSVNVTITITDPARHAGGQPPWANTVKLVFTEGGKPVVSGTPGKPKGAQTLAMPKPIPVYQANWPDHGFDEYSALKISMGVDENHDFFINMDNRYLHNELLRRKDPEKEAAKFAYQWGLMLVALGMLQEMRRQKAQIGDANGTNGDSATPTASPEQLVSRFSGGVAAVIIPTVLNLMEAATSSTAPTVAVAP
ncbi:MAG: hypothetical protein ACLQVA_08475 [Candidatus Brocadiia bacterium]